MKSCVLLFTLCSCLAIPALCAADQPSAWAHRHKKTTELGEHMEKMGHAFRLLGREVNDPTKNADALKQVEIIRVNAEAAAKLKPAKTADVPVDQQAKFVSDYHEKMKGLLVDIDALESALKANNNATAAELVKKLKTDMGQGHKQFRKKMDDM